MKAATPVLLFIAGSALALTALAADEPTSQPAEVAKDAARQADIEARLSALEFDMAEIGRVMLGRAPTAPVPAPPPPTPSQQPPTSGTDPDWQEERQRNRDAARLSELERTVRQLERRVGGPNRDIVTIDAQGIDQQINTLDRRVDSLENRIRNFERELSRLDRQISRIRR